MFPHDLLAPFRYHHLKIANRLRFGLPIITAGKKGLVEGLTVRSTTSSTVEEELLKTPQIGVDNK